MRIDTLTRIYDALASLDRYAGLRAETAEVRIIRRVNVLGSVEYIACVYDCGRGWADGYTRTTAADALDALLDVLDEVIAERDARVAAEAAEREAEGEESIGPFPPPPRLPREERPTVAPFECAGGAS